MCSYTSWKASVACCQMIYVMITTGACPSPVASTAAVHSSVQLPALPQSTILHLSTIISAVKPVLSAYRQPTVSQCRRHHHRRLIIVLAISSSPATQLSSLCWAQCAVGTGGAAEYLSPNDLFAVMVVALSLGVDHTGPIQPLLVHDEHELQQLLVTGPDLLQQLVDMAVDRWRRAL